MEEEKEVEVKDKNIGLILDAYQDLFSDFDPRDFSQKAISDDFLIECKRATIDREEGFELNLLLPNEKRNFSDEIKIKKRLKLHFQKHYHEKEAEIKKIKKEGISWFIIGGLVMFGATFLYEREEFFFRFLMIMSEPAGWFLFWEGLDKIFIDAKEKMIDYLFYKRMANAQINFKDYIKN